MAGRQSGRISVASFGNEEVAGEQHSLGGLCTPLPELVEVDMDVDGQHAAGGPLEGGGEEDGDEEVYYAEMAAHALEQEKMKQEMTVLQRTLELKERKMAELMAGSGQVPALKQHYDRVLAEVQRERDALVNEKTVILQVTLRQACLATLGACQCRMLRPTLWRMQKLAHLTAASEEERRRLEAGFKERLAAADDKLRMLRHKEREYVQIQKLKSQTEDMCRRLSADIHRIKAQKVNLQKTMESSTKQFQQWRVEREKELVQLRRQNRRNAATIQAMEAMASKQNAVLQRKIADANAARKKLRELQGGAVVGHSVRDSAAGAHTNGGGSLGASSGPSAPCWGRAASNGRTS
ncbi:kinesin motor domain-containing protein, partial [Haematococcus lacustris]